VVSTRTSDLLAARLAEEQSGQRLPSVAAGVVRDGVLAWDGGGGRVDGAIPDADVQYRIGSITKTFVAVMIMRLRDEGCLALTDPLDAHLPGTGVGDATIAQLLSHSAGLPAETVGPWWERTPGGDLAALVDGSLGRRSHRFETGRLFHYSNVGFGLLGAVIAAVRGVPWAGAVRDELLVPLGMARTTTRPVAPAAPGLAVHPWADVVLREPEHDAGAMAPAGQLWSTVTDLARWAAFLAGDEDRDGPLAAASRAEMRTPRYVVEDRDGAWVGSYGLGLQVWNEGGVRSCGHGGSMPGFRAFLEFDADGDATVGFANATTGLRGELGQDLLKILADNEPRPPAEWTPVPPPPGTMALLGPWYWGVEPMVLRARGDRLELEPMRGDGRGSRFAPAGDGTWTGLDGYHTGEPLSFVGGHLEIGSFVYTRRPYDPDGGVPGGVDPAGWQPAD
jgi:CubicO group peptidase (beta-lactamase class C family)